MSELTPLLWWAARETGGPVPIVAYESGVPGLVLHRPLASTQVATSFVVAHKDSGHLVFPVVFDSLEEARQGAERLSALADWTEPGPALIASFTSEEIKKVLVS